MHLMKKEKIILGIDPGTNILGFGLVSGRVNDLELITAGIIDMRKITDHQQKLEKIYFNILKIIDKFCPNEVAIEAPFYGKNVQSMLKLGRVQGVVMAAALSKSLIVTEYAPRKVKQAVTGNGNASKEQVAVLITQFLRLKEIPEPLDASDAIATALCHFFQNKYNSGDKKSRTWKDFIRKNPDKII